MRSVNDLRAEIKKLKAEKSIAEKGSESLGAQLEPLRLKVMSLEAEKSAFDRTSNGIAQRIMALGGQLVLMEVYASGTPVYDLNGNTMKDFRLVSVNRIRGSGHVVKVCTVGEFWCGRNRHEVMKGIPERNRPYPWLDVFTLHVQHGRNPALTALGVDWVSTLSEHRRFHRLDEKCRPRS